MYVLRTGIQWNALPRELGARQPQHLCLDAAYDSTPVYQDLLARH